MFRLVISFKARIIMFSISCYFKKIIDLQFEIFSDNSNFSNMGLIMIPVPCLKGY